MESLPIKRPLVHNNESEPRWTSLQGIMNSLNQAAEYITTLQNLACISPTHPRKQKEEETAISDQMVLQVKRLVDDLQQLVKIAEEMARRQKKQVDAIAMHTHLVETMFKAVKEELFQFLPRQSYANLCYTSSTMLKIVSPPFFYTRHMNQAFMHQPIGTTTIKSKFLKPTSLAGVTTVDIPACVDTVYFANDFNQSIIGLPSTITCISFGNLFNQPLSFGANFDCLLDHLPETITHLVFGFCFNQAVNSPPKSMTHLTFGDMFNQPLTNLPHMLKVVEFSSHVFQQSIDDLPNSIYDLTIYTKQPINKLPSSLTSFAHESDVNNLLCPLPLLLECLVVSGGNAMQTLDFSSLRALTHLTITGNDHFNPNLNKLPKTLMELTIFGKWTGTLDALPSSLKELHILGDFNEPLYCLPISLTYLEVRLQYYS